jgi:glucose dehydrogenase
MTRRELFLALGSVTIGSAVLRTSAQQPGAAPRSLDWRLHNLDLAGTRFSPAIQVNTSNVKSLSPRWLFQHGVIDGVSNQTTPIIVDGMMVVTDSRGSVYAVDAADGHLL